MAHLKPEQRARYMQLIDNIFLFCSYEQKGLSEIGDFASRVVTIFLMGEEDNCLEDPGVQQEINELLMEKLKDVLAGRVPSIGLIVKQAPQPRQAKSDFGARANAGKKRHLN